MTDRLTLSRWRWSLLCARAQQALGWPGLVGLTLMAIGIGNVGSAWLLRSSTATELSDRPPSAAEGMAVRLNEAQPPQRVSRDLAPSSDIPLLLTQLQRISLGHGLAWAVGDYRVTPATDAQPASLEVRSSFKGTYSQLRHMLTQVLREVPASTLRELSIGRPGVETAEVEAKVVIAVLLRDGTNTSSGHAATHTP